MLIPKIAYANPDITSQDLFVYINLLCMYRSWAKDEFVFGINTICHFIYGTVDPGRRPRENICNSISSLLSNELLYGEQLDRSTYKISKKSFNDDGAGFVIITSDELFVLNKEHAGLLHYWCFLVSTLNNKTGKGFASRDHFADLLCTSKKTISTYNARLKEIGLLSTTKKWVDNNKSIIYYSRKVIN